MLEWSKLTDQCLPTVLTRCDEVRHQGPYGWNEEKSTHRQKRTCKKSTVPHPTHSSGFDKDLVRRLYAEALCAVLRCTFWLVNACVVCTRQKLTVSKVQMLHVTGPWSGDIVKIMGLRIWFVCWSECIVYNVTANGICMLVWWHRRIELWIEYSANRCVPAAYQ